MIKVTLRKLLASRGSLNKFGELPFDIRTKFEHGELLDELGNMLQKIDKLQKEAVERFDGVVDQKTGAITFRPGGQQEYEAEWNDIMDLERDLDHEPVKFSVFEALDKKLAKTDKSLEFTANDFAVLKWMITS